MPPETVGRDLHGYGIGAQPGTPEYALEARADMARAFRDVYETPQGKMVLDHIVMEMCHHGQLLLNPDPVVSAGKVAQHDVGTKIRKLVSGIIPTSEVKVKTDARPNRTI